MASVLYEGPCGSMASGACLSASPPPPAFTPPPLALGASIELAYPLSGPIPTGVYTIQASGEGPKSGALLEADLLFRHMGAADMAIASVESAFGAGDAGMARLVASVTGFQAASACGDELVLKLTYVSGSADFTRLEATLSLP